MPSLHCNPGLFHWSHPKSAGSFRPEGKFHQTGAMPNPADWESDQTMAARLIVGFNVGKKPKWGMKDLIPIVKRVRTKQAGNPSSTFVAQKGIYQHRDPAKGVVTESGAQVLIINLTALSARDFEKQMIELAEEICRLLKQDEVIVEIQVNGMTQKTLGVKE